MKNYLMIVCAALAMIGCAHNRGGVGDDSQRETGSSERKTTYDRNYKMPKSESSKRFDGSSVTNNVDSGSTSDRSSGAGSQDNQNPPTPQN